MDNDFDKKYDEQNYRDDKRRTYLPRIVLVDLNNLNANEVRVEQLKMLHHLDASIMALTRSRDEGNAATYAVANGMEGLCGAVCRVQDSIDGLRFEQQEHTKALSRIADALERIAPGEAVNKEHDNTDRSD